MSTRLGTATYRGRSTGVYALATPLGGNVGAVKSDLELTADFTGGGLTGTFDGFSILLEAATGEGWQGVPTSITVAGRLLDEELVLTDAGFPLEVGAVGSGQLDSDFLWPSLTGAWNVKRNQVPGLAPHLPDLPEVSVKAGFFKDAAEAIGTVETIGPLTVKRGTSTGSLSLSMSFGADTGDDAGAAAAHCRRGDRRTGLQRGRRRRRRPTRPRSPLCFRPSRITRIRQ